jgi:uncharacterized protein
MSNGIQGGIQISQPAEQELNKRGVFQWPIWEKEVSRFDWTYDTVEQCYFLAGQVRVETPDGIVDIKKGDWVTFPKGLKCVWDVREPVRKHYKFG